MTSAPPGFSRIRRTLPRSAASRDVMRCGLQTDTITTNRKVTTMAKTTKTTGRRSASKTAPKANAAEIAAMERKLAKFQADQRRAAAAAKKKTGRPTTVVPAPKTRLQAGAKKKAAAPQKRAAAAAAPTLRIVSKPALSDKELKAILLNTSVAQMLRVNPGMEILDDEDKLIRGKRATISVLDVPKMH